MPVPPHPVESLLARLREGDEDAARELVEVYEPYIRRAIRPQIAKYNLRAAIDSADICQSVLGGFLIRLALGQFQISSPQDLEHLLLGIMRKKFAHLVRREYASRRDRNRHQSLGDEQVLVGGDATTPDEIAMRRDLLERLQAKLSIGERHLLRMRLERRSWAEIAELVGETETTLRQRLSRALRQAVQDLEAQD